jgi:hypothetical protein
MHNCREQYRNTKPGRIMTTLEEQQQKAVPARKYEEVKI